MKNYIITQLLTSKKALLDVGINRIGIGQTFLHCDVDKEKDQDVFWLYD